jgi:hypothetical protein
MTNNADLKLNVEALEERVAPSPTGFGPSNNGNPGNEVSNGAKPHPAGGGH